MFLVYLLKKIDFIFLRIIFNWIIMGIRSLIPLLKRNCKNNIHTINIQSLSGKKIAIDTSIFLYKFSYFNPNFIGLFSKMCVKFGQNKITPVFIFDGKPPEEKNATLENRKKQKDELNNKITELKDKVNTNNLSANETDTIKKEIKKLEKCNIKITPNKIKILKELFDEIDVQYFDSPTEAELMCVELCKQGYVDYILTEDTDVFPMGCPYVLRDYNINDDNMMFINLDEILNSLNIDFKQFQDLCIMCGCDYTCTIPKIGGVTSLKLIKEHKNIENIINCVPNVPNEFNFIKSRELFNEKINIKNIKIYNKPPKIIDSQRFTEISNKFQF